MKTLALLLTILAVANAMENFFWLGDYADEMGQVGKGCCLPTQWEGRVGSLHITKKFLKPKVRASDSKIGLDFAGKKVAARSLFYCRKARRTFEARTVADFNAKKAYFIFKDKCKAFSIKREMSKPCIPDFFKQFSNYFYGADSSSLAVTPYGYRNGSVEAFSVVTSGNCVPVKGAFRVTHGHRSSMGTYQYYNITLGNKDKDLYSVPESCNSANATSNKPSLWRKFRKFVGYTTEEPFNQESQLGDLVERDAMAQVMDIIDNNAMMVGMANDHQHKTGHDRSYQRRHHGSMGPRFRESHGSHDRRPPMMLDD